MNMDYNVEFLDDNVQFILHAIKSFFYKQKELAEKQQMK